MSHYFNNIGHPHKIDSTIKYRLADTGASGTYTRSEDPHENAHKRGHTIFISPASGNKMSSNIACALALPHFPDKSGGAHLLPGISHSSLLSIVKLYDAGCE